MTYIEIEWCTIIIHVYCIRFWFAYIQVNGWTKGLPIYYCCEGGRCILRFAGNEGKFANYRILLCCSYMLYNDDLNSDGIYIYYIMTLTHILLLKNIPYSLNWFIYSNLLHFQNITMKFTLRRQLVEMWNVNNANCGTTDEVWNAIEIAS